jgi:hypothetical protein
VQSSEIEIAFVSIPTAITATATPRQQVIGQSITIKGHLTASGVAVANVPVTLYNADNIIERALVSTTTTDAAGFYQFTLSETAPGDHSYFVHSPGTNTYAPVQSSEIEIAFVSIPTAITATATPRQQVIGHDVTVTGRLLADSSPVAEAPITLYNADNVIERVSVSTTTTDAAGFYQFTLTDTAQSHHTYTVHASGSLTHEPCVSDDVSVTFISIPTAITATATPRQQVIGQSITIKGHLTASGMGVVGVSVDLYMTDDPTKKVLTASTTTDGSGFYQFTETESVATTHAYNVCAEANHIYSRAQSTEILLTWARAEEVPPVITPELPPVITREAPAVITPELPPVITREAPAVITPELPPVITPELPPVITRVVLNLAWYELLSILLIVIGEGLLFTGNRPLGVGVQALNIVAVAIVVAVLREEQVQLVEALALISVFRVINLSFALVLSVSLYWLIIIYGVMYVPLVLIIIHEKLSRSDVGIDNVRRSVLLLPLGVVIGTGFALIEQAILTNEVLIPNFSAIELIQLSIVMIFFVAVVEELLFRVVLQRQLIDRSGALAGILLTSVIFGAMHAGYANVYELLFATAAGAVLGVAFYKTKDLALVVTIHAVNNIILFGLLAFFPHLIAVF